MTYIEIYVNTNGQASLIRRHNLDGWNSIFDSILRICSKLKRLGFTYYSGKVTTIHPEKEEKSGV